MSDDFLGTFRERPDPAFTEALYQRISAPRGLWGIRHLVWVPAMLGLVVVSAFVASPALRAGALSVVRQIAGVEIVETDQYPAIEGPVFRAESTTVTLDQVDGILPFDLHLPAWSPPGFTLVSDVEVIPATDRRPIATAIVTWRKRQRTITLSVEQRPDAQAPMRIVAGVATAEAVDVDGIPAALVRGTWRADENRYDASQGITLVWVRDELIYTLRTMDDRLSGDDLVRMAASAP